MVSATSAGVIYLDTSAFMKLVAEEAESAALRRYLRSGRLRTSAILLQTEGLRAAARLSAAHLGVARQLLRGLALIQADRQLYAVAGALPPPELRSLDALHVAAALALGQDLAEFVTYDHRMIDAARLHGLPVVSPT
jgi:predicted nucleic acid-binding protein